MKIILKQKHIIRIKNITKLYKFYVQHFLTHFNSLWEYELLEINRVCHWRNHYESQTKFNALMLTVLCVNIDRLLHMYICIYVLVHR